MRTFEEVQQELFRSVGTFNGAVFDTQTFNASSTVLTGTRSNVIKRIAGADGWRDPTPYVAAFTEASRGLLSYHRTQASDTRFEYQGLGFGHPVTADLSDVPDLPPSLRHSTLIQALKSLNNKKIEVGVALLESRQAIDLIGSSARRLAGAISATIRKDHVGVARALGVKVLKPRDALKTASGIWLSYHFGWAPIISDVVGACALLSDEEIHKRIRIVAKSRSFLNYESVATAIASSPDTYVNYKVAMEHKDKVEFSVSLYYSLVAEELRKLAQWGGTDPFGTAWAVVPYSFVIDWFLPIGDVLEAFSASVGLAFRGGSQTTFKERKTKSVGFNPSSPGQTILSFSNTYPLLRSVSMNRQVFVDEPVPSPLYFKNPLSVWRTVTSVALLSRFL